MSAPFFPLANRSGEDFFHLRPLPRAAFSFFPLIFVWAWGRDPKHLLVVLRRVLDLGLLIVRSLRSSASLLRRSFGCPRYPTPPALRVGGLACFLASCGTVGV
jgi:hypothetical protein